MLFRYLTLVLVSAFLATGQEPAVTLAQAVHMAIERHQDVGKARAAADALKGKIREVRSQALPDVQFVSNATCLRDPSLLNASGLDKFPEELREALVPSAVNLFDFAITVKQPLFTQGKVGTALRLASIEAEGSISEIDRAQQDVAVSTVKRLLRPAVGRALPRPGGGDPGAKEAARRDGPHPLSQRRGHGSGRAALGSGRGQRTAGPGARR